MTLTPDGDVFAEDASGQGREIQGIRWSENRAQPSGIRRERVPHSDASSDTFNFAALRKPQWLRHGLTSIGVAQVSLIPRMEFGSPSRGLPPVRPWLFVSRGSGVYETRSEVSLVDKCVRKLIGFATSVSPLLLPSCIPVVTRYVEKFRCGEKLWNH